MTFRIIQGDCLDVLRALPAEHVHCVVTSPPYWGLRDYGVEGQLGLEPTPEAYVNRLVEVFREVRRVLRKDGTLWLNLGDSYASETKGSGGPSAKQDSNAGSLFASRKFLHGLKPKDLCGIPWRVAFALQADGWWLRSDIIWAKPNPMPESVTDRPTKAHENLFLLAQSGSATYWVHRDGKGSRAQPPPDYRWVDRDQTETAQEPPHWRSEKLPDGKPRWRRINLWRGEDYYYDADAVREPAEESSGWSKQRAKGINTWQYNDTPERLAVTGQRIEASTLGTQGQRNLRSVWTIPTQPFSDWQETYRLDRVERDAVSDDTMRITFPSCPVHGGQRHSLPKVFCDERGVDALNHTLRKHGHPALLRLDDCAPIDPTRVRAMMPQSSGCCYPVCSPSATDHNTENCKTGHVPATSQPYTPYGRMSDRTGHTQGVSLFGAPHPDRRESNTGESDCADSRTSQTPCCTDGTSGEGGSCGASVSLPNICSCQYYQVTTEKSSHFAVFPPKLVEPCILAGTSPKVCPKCGAPWERVVARTGVVHRRETAHAPFSSATKVDSTGWQPATVGTNHFAPTCACPNNDGSAKAVVLDPFSGAGTTGLVAIRHGREYIGIELNPEYVEMSKRRITEDAPLLHAL